MYIDAVANKYVRAFMSSLPNKAINNEISSKIERYVSFINGNSKIYKFIVCQFISFEEKRKILDEIFDFLAIDGFLKQFLLLIIKNNKIYLMNDVVNSLKMNCLNNNNTKIVTITSNGKFQLTTSLKNHIVSLLERKMNCTILLEERISDDLIGGVLLECDSLLLDLSVDKLMKMISLELKNTKIQLI